MLLAQDVAVRVQTGGAARQRQLRDDGFMEFGQRFLFKEAALKLAGELRQDLEREGWRELRVDPPDDAA